MALICATNPNAVIFHEESKYNIAKGVTAVSMTIWNKTLPRVTNFNCCFQINKGTTGSRTYRSRITGIFDRTGLQAAVRDSDGSWWGMDQGTTPQLYYPLGTWQFVVAVWNLTTNRCKFFHNGSLVVSRDMACPYTTYSDTKPNNITFFGRNALGNSFGDPYIGTLEDARIYDRELSSAEIRELFSKRGGDGVLDYKFRAYMTNKTANTSAVAADLKYAGSEKPAATSVPAVLKFAPGICHTKRSFL